MIFPFSPPLVRTLYSYSYPNLRRIRTCSYIHIERDGERERDQTKENGKKTNKKVIIMYFVWSIHVKMNYVSFRQINIEIVKENTKVRKCLVVTTLTHNTRINKKKNKIIRKKMTEDWLC